MDVKHWELIAKYLSADFSAEEKSELLEWRNQHPGNEQRFKQIQHIWQSIEKKEERSPGPEHSWEILKEKLLQEGPEVKVFPISQNKKRWWLAAASIVLFIGIGYLLFSKTELTESIATTDHLDVFYLPDSSLVWLNKNSNLKYPKQFGKERIVYLEGEAFFKVKKDPKKPFIVYAENTRTKVLGTSFNLRAYEKEKDVQLVVATGEVEFSSKKASTKKILLHKNDKAIIGKKKREIKKIKNDNPDFMSWKNNRADIHQTKLYQQEVSNPYPYLYSEFTWRDNLIKQTVIEGKIYNSAIFTSYRTIKLRVSHYTKGGEKVGEEDFILNKTLYPGLHLPYKLRLSNWLEDTRKVKIEIIGANALKN